MEDATEEEKKIVKKMILVALWCIQMKLVGRPSMNRVVEMLEGEVECLQMPSKPFLSSSPERPVGDVGENSNSTCSSIQSVAASFREGILPNLIVLNCSRFSSGMDQAAQLELAQ
ncbi:rust resistance kinase lr10 [Fagus crenata]